MSEPRAASTAPLDYRVKILAVLAVLAILYVIIQHTSFAPFPHRADGFVQGFAVGATLATIIGWFGTRA